MTAEWTPIVVAIVSGLLLLPPAILALIGSRAEPRRLKELKALNEVLRDLPDTDESHAPLSAYRSALAQAYSERPTRVDPAVVVLGPLVVGWVLASVGLFLMGSRGRPMMEVFDSTVGWIAVALLYVGLVAVAVGVVLAVFVAIALCVRFWRRGIQPHAAALSTTWRRRHSLRDLPEEA